MPAGSGGPVVGSASTVDPAAISRINQGRDDGKPFSVAGSKIIETVVALPAGASTQLLAARPNRVALELQPDGTADVLVSRNGAALAAITAPGMIIPSGTKPLYTFPVVSQSAITAFTATAQNVRVTEYLS